MPLSPGDKLGPYEILAPLGKGGMGEVYRARDSKLHRDVAIKVLPAALANDLQYMARFEREAQMLAALNHANIAAVYGIEQGALVMELVEGAELKGPLPVDEAIAIARQIAAGLEAAHEKGIVHRDLKPGNIKLTPAGVVKILDFGLAKSASESNMAGSSATLSPTLSLEMTRAGMILGTAAYMSPEQARGKAVDKRADTWAFGVVLYELVTGRRLFDGEDLAETLASVVKDRPDLSGVPAAVRRLLERCLEKDPKKRLRDIGDMELLLVEQVSGVSGLPSLARGLRHWVPWIAAGVFAMVAVVLAFIHFRVTPPPEQTLRYTIAAPEKSSVQSFAISPDGRTLVISAQVNGKRQLWLRPMDALQLRPMAFTDEGAYPFWSPDSHYIGFFAQGKLKKVAASGGPAQSLCDVNEGNGGSWNRDGVIVFPPQVSGASIQRISASGGVPADVTKTKGIQLFPVFLPGGSHFLYEARGAAEKAGIYVSSLDGRENRRILPDASGVVFAPSVRGERTGHLLFIRENTLMAAPFDPVSAQVSGDVVPVSDGVPLSGMYLPVTVSENGVLLYAAAGSAGGQNQLRWFDRAGKSLGLVGMPGDVLRPAISPDEKSVAFSHASSGGSDLWLRDLSRGTQTRFTSDASSNEAPSWSPKGDRIVFTSNRTGVYNLYQKAAGGSGQDEPLLPNRLGDVPSQWSRDGRFIVYFELDPKTKRDLWVLPTEGILPTEGGAPGRNAGRKPIPFLRTEANEILGQLSPDSLWMAFTSDRSGKREVYVRPFPSGEGEWTISLAGGQAPRWSGDGKELFFEAADGRMMAVAVKAVAGAKPSFEAGAPVPLFDAHMAHVGADVVFEYDVTADGKRFLINTTGGPDAATAPPLTVVTNWTAGLKK